MGIKKLVLLPGLDGTGLLLQPLLEALGDTIPVQVIRYPSDCIGVEELAAYVRRQVTFDAQTILLAESFSGLVVMALLRQKIPLHSVIFCASFVSSPRPWVMKWVRPLPMALLFRLPLPTLLLRLWVRDARLSGLIPHVRRQAPTKVLAHRLRLIAAAQSAPAEQIWNIPCHYLQGARDWIVPKRCAEAFRDYFSEVDVSCIKPAGHFLLQCQPVACAAIIRQIVA